MEICNQDNQFIEQLFFKQMKKLSVPRTKLRLNKDFLNKSLDYQFSDSWVRH